MDWAPARFRDRPFSRRRLGGDGAYLLLFGHMATHYQHGNHNRHVFNGVLDPKFANRDSAAIQVKLDELIRVGEVKDTFVGIEHLTKEEIEELREKCEKAARQHFSRAAKH